MHASSASWPRLHDEAPDIARSSGWATSNGNSSSKSQVASIAIAADELPPATALDEDSTPNVSVESDMDISEDVILDQLPATSRGNRRPARVALDEESWVRQGLSLSMIYIG